VVLALDQRKRGKAPLNPQPPPFRVEEAALVDATRFDTSPRLVLEVPVAICPSSHRPQTLRPEFSAMPLSVPMVPSP
jgi:hypothetical protein